MRNQVTEMRNQVAELRTDLSRQIAELRVSIKNNSLRARNRSVQGLEALLTPLFCELQNSADFDRLPPPDVFPLSKGVIQRWSSARQLSPLETFYGKSFGATLVEKRQNFMIFIGID